MNKFLTSLLFSCMLIVNVFACWFTQENFNNAYIAGVNYFETHYEETSNMYESKYINGQNVTLPLTMWFLIKPREQNINNVNSKFYIRQSILYYKILPNGVENSSCKWRIAKSLNMGNNPSWNLDFSSPVKLFGDNTLSLALIRSNGDRIKSGDHIIFVWYVIDNSPNSISNGKLITPNQQLPIIQVDDLVNAYDANGEIIEYDYGYSPNAIIRVIYNGKMTVGR